MANKIKKNKTDNPSSFIIKMDHDLRNEMKKEAHSRGMTMQSLFLAFAKSYIEDPGKFQIKMSIGD